MIKWIYVEHLNNKSMSISSGARFPLLKKSTVISKVKLVGWGKAGPKFLITGCPIGDDKSSKLRFYHLPFCVGKAYWFGEGILLFDETGFAIINQRRLPPHTLTVGLFSQTDNNTLWILKLIASIDMIRQLFALLITCIHYSAPQSGLILPY